MLIRQKPECRRKGYHCVRKLRKTGIAGESRRSHPAKGTDPERYDVQATEGRRYKSRPPALAPAFPNRVSLHPSLVPRVLIRETHIHTCPVLPHTVVVGLLKITFNESKSHAQITQTIVKVLEL